ncbi:MAG: hypothetical protein JSV33_11855 [bacterium]|nr:MAG: hypothetical protein JSV33_11855 [bacterium]
MPTGCLAVVLVLSVLTTARCRAACVGTWVWVEGRGGTLPPGEDLDWIGLRGNRRCIALLSTCSNPYSIDDLLVYSFRLGMRTPQRACWFGWSALDHTLYREDHVTLEYRQILFCDRLRLGVRPVCTLMQVEGYPIQTEMSVSLSVSCAVLSRAAVGLEGALAGSGSSPSTSWILRLSAGIELISLLYQRNLWGSSHDDHRFGMMIHLCESLTLLSGYRLDTDEVTWGIVTAPISYVCGVASRYHPVLGPTRSVGAGKVWSW